VTGSLPLGELLEDGTLARGLEISADEGELSWLLEPRWAAEVESWKKLPKLSHKPEGRLPFDAEDLKLLDDIFEVHLPKIFGVPPEIGHRPAQHTVAQETAAVLGRDRDSKRSGVEILLVHAPTGTGKTLAYLIPLLLWSTRHGARTCVATYTRTLQEQAFDSDVPRALQALRRAGLSDDLRVSILKGRENYACWRSTSMQSPDPDAAGEDWLAWTRYLLFCAADTEGDLDRLPETAPIPFADTRSWRNADSGLRRRVRARSGCCRHETDRRTCAAHGARVRAERSHVVITNQAYALTNQEFAHHIVFDECEHLHDQADSVFSHGVTLRELGAVLGRVSGGSGRRRGALDAALKVAHVGGDAYASAEEGVRATESARAALDLLYGEVTRFVAWKKEASRGREDRDTHSLMREFVLSEEGHDLIEARKSLADHLSEVEQSLSALSEHLDELKGRRSAKVRRRLDLARTDLVEIISHISAWIPISEGRISFSTSRYYDAEELPSGDVELVARILLPNEVLGQEYYPNLKTAIFVSATTWLKGGFESARYYLGIDYAELPRPEVEDFLPARVTTFRSPEAFDYSRVIVTAPKDLPHPSRNTAAHLAHIRRYTAYLAERTRGRVLVLFTNSEHVRQVGAELEGFFRARSIPFWYQGMEGASKEELSELFRRTTDSVLLGVDTFWYGADFPGPTLEHLIITKLPFGVPDRYHHAQCAALSKGEHWKKIYMPRALAKFRQGFGRLMRRESDKGVVHILDPRILDPRNRVFQRELPIYKEAAAEEDTSELARFVQGNSSRCLHEALAHMELLADIERRELQLPFEEFQATSAPTSTHSDSDADLLTPFPSSAQEGPNDDYGDRLPSHIDLREFLPWADEGDSTA
jgi:Rad3-related DNA helicase